MADLDELWASWDAGGRTDAGFEALVAAGQPFVRIMVHASRAGSEHAAEDLRSEGMIGFIDAVRTYDPGRGAKFTTHAQNKVRSKIRDMMRRNDPLSRGARARDRQLETATARLTQRLGRAPGDDEIAEHLHWDERKVQMTRFDAAAAQVESTADHDLEGSESDTYDRICSRVAAAMDKLVGPERAVVVLYYIEEMTMEEVAHVLGVSRSLVSRIRDRAAQQVIDELRRS